MSEDALIIDPDRIYTPAQIASAFACSPKIVRDNIRSGEMAAATLSEGRRPSYRIRGEDQMMSAMYFYRRRQRQRLFDAVLIVAGMLLAAYLFFA